MSVDPIVAVTAAPYAYANNDPANAVDPAGLIPSCLSLPSWVCKAKAWVESKISGPANAAQNVIVEAQFGNAQDIFPIAQLASPGCELNLEAPFGSPAGGIGGGGSVNQMNRAIERGQAPSGVRRVDPADPNVPGSQDHVHFEGLRGTLNRDGTWGHGGEGTGVSNEISQWLREFGWDLP